MDRMILALNSSDEQNQALDALIAAQQDYSSPSYQQWLTPEQFAEQFGVSENDFNQVTSWLKDRGFKIDEMPAGRRTVVFSGNAGMVNRAFHTTMRQYQVNGETHYANSTDPEIPAALAEVVNGAVTLHDFPRKSLSTLKQSMPEFSNGGSYYLAPADFATIYNLNPLYTAGIDGTGTSIAIVGRTNINVSDVTLFRSYFGLPANNPQVILNGPNPGINSDVDEAILDVEWAGAVGRGATVKFVVSDSTNSTDGVDLSAQYIVSNNIAKVMSTSYGSCEGAMGSAEMAFYKNLWQQASVQGISTMISSGDSGVAGCDGGSASKAAYGKAINGLCSSIYSVCVGGTQFADTTNYGSYWLTGMNATNKGSAISYIPEAVWNQSGTVSGGSGLWAAGSGASAVFAKPSWQAGPGVPADGKRDVPDVSLAASTHDGFLVVEGGYLYVIGGTSASSPAFAGIMALVNQKNGAQGNPNPTLYALAALESNHTTAHTYFHDITSGNNSVPGLTGYSAGAGYDLATGLGTVNASDLVNFWKDATVTPYPSIGASMSPVSLTVRQGGSGTSTASITVAGGFSSAVTLTATGLPAGVTASFARTSLAAPGSGTSVLTFAPGVTAVPGTSTVTVTAVGGGLTSTASVTLTVVQAYTLTTNVSTLTVKQGASAPVTLTSAIASGFSGAVALSAVVPAGVTVGFTPSTIAAPGSGPATLTVAATSTAAPGTYSITLKGTSGSYSSTATVAVTVTAAATFTLSASPATITAAPGSSAASTVTMTPVSGFTSPVALSANGMPPGVTVQFSTNNITKGNVTVTANASATTTAGSYLITVTGTGGGVSPAPTAVVTLVVSGFKVNANPVTASVTRGSTVSIPITTTSTSGFSGSLNLTITGLPAGVTTVFTPASVSASGSSSLKLTAATSATVGTKAITIVATSAAGAVQTAPLTLTVK